MIECAVHTGILFSRKGCGKPATIHCGRCEIPLCKEHVVPQQSGPFLCPQCDRYLNDRGHDWEYSDRSWRWRGSRTRDESPASAPAPVSWATGALPAALDEQDQEGFAADDSAGGPGDADADADSEESDFDAS